jgi:hypothetical protein
MMTGKGRERPLARSVIKFLASLFLGRARAHYHSWLPFLAIEGRNSATAGRAVYRGRVAVDLKTSEHLGAACGSAIYIIGSGPSVVDQDLTVLPSGSGLLLNGSIALIGKQIDTPLAIAIEDERFVWRHFAMMCEKIAPQDTCLFSVGVMRAICEIDPDWLGGRPIILIDDIRKPFGGRRRTVDELAALEHVRFSASGDVGFSEKPDAGVFQGGSVVISALQFACAMPAKTIGLIGIDISNAASPRFYETKDAVAYSGVADAEARILSHVGLARNVAREQGIAVRNHSPISALRKIGMSHVPLPSSV